MTTSSSTSVPAPAAPAPTGRPSATATCCRREMSRVEVTARGTSLALHTCASCGRHVWERDGQQADRAELLDGVKVFLEQPRGIVRRRRRRA